MKHSGMRNLSQIRKGREFICKIPNTHIKYFQKKCRFVEEILLIKLKIYFYENDSGL